jgi:hypothetical protein
MKNKFLDEGHALLAIVDVLSSTVPHKERLAIFQKYLAYVLQSLEEASKQ